MLAKIAFSTSAKDYPWYVRKVIEPIIKRIKDIYFEKSVIVAMKTRHVLVSQGQILTREMIDKGLKL
jgi:predicted DNA-binding protein